MDINLLVIVVIGVVFVLGLILALQTAAGRKGLSGVALRLAEALLAYAIRWLESLGTSAPDVPGVTMIESESHDLARARAAQACLRSVAVREIEVNG